MTQHTAETVARIRAKVAEGYMPAVDDVQVLLDEHDRLAALVSLRGSESAPEPDEVDENEDDVDLDYGYAQGDSERA